MRLGVGVRRLEGPVKKEAMAGKYEQQECLLSYSGIEEAKGILPKKRSRVSMEIHLCNAINVLLLRFLRNRFIQQPLAITFLAVRLHHLQRLLNCRQLPSTSIQALDLRLRHLVHILAQMFHTRHFCSFHFIFQPPTRWEHFSRGEQQLVRSFEELDERFPELVACFEDGTAAEDVETKAGAGQRDCEAADVPEVTDAGSAHQGEDDICSIRWISMVRPGFLLMGLLTVILLPLIFIHRRHQPRQPEKPVLRATMAQDISDQRPLSRVRRQY